MRDFSGKAGSVEEQMERLEVTMVNAIGGFVITLNIDTTVVVRINWTNYEHQQNTISRAWKDFWS